MAQTTILSGGRVVTPEGIIAADLEIEGELIRQVAIPGGLRANPDGVQIDVTGKVILPGLVDTHAHLREPGHGHKEDILHGSSAAAAGGYTTIVGMPNVSPPTTTVERYEAAMAIYARQSIVDFNHHPVPTDLGEIAGLAAAGALAYKVYLISDATRDYLREPGLAIQDNGQLYEAMAEIGRTGRPVFVHPHDQALMRAIEAPYLERGDRDYRAYARAFAAHEGIVWDTASALVVRLAEATGVHLHLLHIKTKRMIDIVRRAKSAGQAVTCEINPVSILLANDWASIERVGPYALSTWTGEGQTEALWAALNDGTIDVIGTDHAPHTRAEKELGWTDMWKASGGLPHLQETLPLFLTQVAAGRLSLERLVRLASSEPARLLGIWPRKGAILPGSDADLVVVDLAARGTIREEEMLSKCGWTAWNGTEVEGLPWLTMVRGRVVYRDGKVIGEAGWGRQVRRLPGSSLPAS
jgi:dihydroorotase (multifunctional complex type)